MFTEHNVRGVDCHGHTGLQQGATQRFDHAGGTNNHGHVTPRHAITQVSAAQSIHYGGVVECLRRRNGHSRGRVAPGGAEVHQFHIHTSLRGDIALKIGKEQRGGTTETEHGLLQVTADNSQVRFSHQTGHQLPRSRIKMLGIIHDDGMPSARQRCPQHLVHQLRSGVTAGTVEGHDRLVLGEEITGGAPSGNIVLLPHLFQLCRCECALHHTQQKITQLAGKAHHRQRRAEFFRPRPAPVFHMALEEFTDSKVLLRARDQTNLATFTAIYRFSCTKESKSEGVNGTHNRLIRNEAQSGQFVR